MKQNHFFLYLLLFFTSNLLAQNELPAQDYLKWGEVKVPIHELVNGSNGDVKLKIATVLDNADQPLALFKNGRDAGLQQFFLIVSKRGSTNETEFLAVRNYDIKDAASHHGSAYLRKHLAEGENIYFRNLMGKDSVEHFLRIEILEERPKAKLKFTLPKIPTEEVFGFQILELEGEKIKVKIDTTSLETRRIFNTYKSYNKYEIVHVPNFKTTRRYVTPKDLIQKPDVPIVNLVEDAQLKNANVELFPDFWAYNGNEVELKLGEMLAGKNYDVFDLQNAIEGRFLLSVGFQNFSIRLMDVMIVSEDTETKIYRVENFKHPDLQAVLRHVRPGTTILFTDILIENQKGAFIHFPNAFSFGIQ